MNETKLRVAAITLFMRALIDELDPKDKARKSAVAICSRGKSYVNKTFKNQCDKDLLSTIANSAYDDACTLSEMKDIAVGSIVSALFESDYKQDLMTYAKLNPKHVESFFNGYREKTGLRLRISNKQIAHWCISCINKQIYKNFTKGGVIQDGKNEPSGIA